MKGTILSSQNDKNFIWYRFKPEVLSLQCVDKIRFAFDEYKEPRAEYNLKQPYENQIPKNFGFQCQEDIFAIMICDKDSINYILIKSHPLFEKVNKMVQEEFDFLLIKKRK
jgi:hypothetical protein